MWFITHTKFDMSLRCIYFATSSFAIPPTPIDFLINVTSNFKQHVIYPLLLYATHVHSPRNCNERHVLLEI